jgi:hypothetical protein
MIDEFAPVLSPEWRHTFGGLERAVAEFEAREHGPCDCQVCTDLAETRVGHVALAWFGLDAGQRTRWLDAYGLDARGAAMRDALVEADTAFDLAKMAAHLEALRDEHT